MAEQITIKKTLKDVNTALYEALAVLFEANKCTAGGEVDYPDKDYGWISNDLDYLAVKYFKEEPDGTKQEEYAEDGEPDMTDEEAYELLMQRFVNTRIVFESGNIY